MAAMLAGLQACGGGGDSGPAAVGPTAEVATTGTLREFGTFGLDASGSLAGDAPIETFEWEQVSGPFTALDRQDGPTVEGVIPKRDPDESLVFRLTVRDEAGLSDSTEITLDIEENRYFLHSTHLDPAVPTEARSAEIASLDTDWARSLPLPVGNHQGFFVSPDRRLVAIPMGVADQPSDQQLYVVELKDQPEVVFEYKDHWVDGRNDNDGIPDGRIDLATWSPDGRYLSFRAGQCAGRSGAYYTDCTFNLFTWEVATGTLTQLTDVEHVDNDGDGRTDRYAAYLAWNADASRVVYMYRWKDTASFEAERHVPYAADPDGNNRVALVDFERDELDNTDLYVNGAINYTPDGLPDTDRNLDGNPDGSVQLRKISPDGRTAILLGDATVRTVNDAYAVNVDGTGFTALSNYGLEDMDGDTRPDFDRNDDGISDADAMSVAVSPAGDRLALTDNNARLFGQDIYIMDLDGSNRTRLLDFLAEPYIYGRVGRFTWSDDGSLLAFAANSKLATRQDLYVSDGTPDAAVRLTAAFGHDRMTINAVNWAPDENRVIYRGNSNNQTRFEYFTLATDDPASLATMIPADVDYAGVSYALEFSPDGSEAITTVWTPDASLPSGGFYKSISNAVDAGNLVRHVDSADTWAGDNNGRPGDEGDLNWLGYIPGGGRYIYVFREGDYANLILEAGTGAADGDRLLTAKPMEGARGVMTQQFIGPLP